MRTAFETDRYISCDTILQAKIQNVYIYIRKTGLSPFVRDPDVRVVDLPPPPSHRNGIACFFFTHTHSV